MKTIIRRALQQSCTGLALLLALGLAQATEPAVDPDAARGWAAYTAADYGTALAHYRKAAAREQPLAQYNLAVMLVQGLGTEARPQEGIGWLRKAAEHGLPQAQHSLAEFHERGAHVAKSAAEAVHWYRKAAEQGLADAQVGLATQYFVGRGALPQDYAEATRWYERAAEQGHGGACYVVASMYEHGNGVAKRSRARDVLVPAGRGARRNRRGPDGSRDVPAFAGTLTIARCTVAACHMPRRRGGEQQRHPVPDPAFILFRLVPFASCQRSYHGLQPWQETLL